MGMSKKHYQALAEALAKPTKPYGSKALAQQLANIVPVVESIADMCYADNDRFDYRRFYDAFIAEIDEMENDPRHPSRQIPSMQVLLALEPLR